MAKNQRYVFSIVYNLNLGIPIRITESDTTADSDVPFYKKNVHILIKCDKYAFIADNLLFNIQTTYKSLLQ